MNWAEGGFSFRSLAITLFSVARPRTQLQGADKADIVDRYAAQSAQSSSAWASTVFVASS